jgi:Uma2 family endonuclease
MPRCGVAEVWVVDMNERAIHVFREPSGEGYRKTSLARAGQAVECAALPSVAIEVGELF